MVDKKQFRWSHKDGNGSTGADGVGVGQTARAMIKDYINKNQNKTAEQLKIDLDIWGSRKPGEWEDSGHHPFTLAKAVPKDQKPSRYFRDIIRLNSGEEILISNEWGSQNHSKEKWENLKSKMQEHGYDVSEVGIGANSDFQEENAEAGSEELISVSQELLLLQQFKQIVLYGPPGTGKTFRAMDILPKLLEVDKSELAGKQGARWNIVQFHPSYNYEDFVRGVEVGTEEGKVVYNTVNKIFGYMCLRALRLPHLKHALIIDEINRANVSAVLGELIYALEPDYRGRAVSTPYAVSKGKRDLVVPKNLYIIGTMNTADRTIGQIDYAVRRRFAFMHCPPKESIIQNKNARDAFRLVDEIFSKEKKYMSQDYDTADVRIGHSYFMAEGSKLARKIVYQVVPILREYIKDGILSKDAARDIDAIEQQFANEAKKKDKLDEDSEEGSIPIFYWEGDGISGIDSAEHTALSIFRHYAEKNQENTIENIQNWFSGKEWDSDFQCIKLASEIDDNNREDFLTQKGEELNIGGQIAYASNQWEVGTKLKSKVFSGVFRRNGYSVRLCYFVKVDERNEKRGWEESRDWGFVSASGGSSRTKALREIEKGDVLFAYLLGADKKKGFIGMGEVEQAAVPIKEFKVSGTNILDFLCKDGRKYRHKYPLAAEHVDDEEKREWVVGVKWKKPFVPREEVKGKTTRKHVVYWIISPKNLAIIKNKFEEAR